MQLTVNIVQYKLCVDWIRTMDLSVLEATALPTESQPLPFKFIVYYNACFFKSGRRLLGIKLPLRRSERKNSGRHWFRGLSSTCRAFDAHSTERCFCRTQSSREYRDRRRYSNAGL